MLREDIRKMSKATPRDLRRFGLTVGGVFCALGLWFFLRHKPFYWYVLVPGAPLFFGGVILPAALKWVYVAWMAMALVLGAIVSTILLTALFYIVVTPIGLIARLAGKDFLSRKLDPETASYWIVRDTSKPREKHDHERQF